MESSLGATELYSQIFHASESLGELFETQIASSQNQILMQKVWLEPENLYF